MATVLAIPCDALPHGEFGDACYALFQILCLFGLAVSAQPHHAHPGSCVPMFSSLFFASHYFPTFSCDALFLVYFLFLFLTVAQTDSTGHHLCCSRSSGGDGRNAGLDLVKAFYPEFCGNSPQQTQRLNK